MDARSDLFALGALLHRLATGTTLYEGDSSAEVLQLAAQGNLKPIRERAPEIPAHLGAIIDRLVAPRPEDRFSSADEVSHALSRVLQPGRRIAVWVGRAAAVLARDLRADLLIIATDAPGVFLDYGTPTQRLVASAHPDALAGHPFPDGSMGPKVESALAFARTGSGRAALIGSLEELPATLDGTAGTRVSLAEAGLTVR